MIGYPNRHRNGVALKRTLQGGERRTIANTITDKHQRHAPGGRADLGGLYDRFSDHLLNCTRYGDRRQTPKRRRCNRSRNKNEEGAIKVEILTKMRLKLNEVKQYDQSGKNICDSRKERDFCRNGQVIAEKLKRLWYENAQLMLGSIRKSRRARHK